MERPERLSLQSADGAQLNLDALYQIAPSCFTEAADHRGGVKRVVNFDVLRQLLGDDAVEDVPEAYEFNWVGKQAARAEVLRPINKTLRPVKEDSVDWDTTQNLYIEGDNLEVLKLLQKSYLGKVKMIYIDPPYNTGNDFVYHDDFARTKAEEDLFAGNVDELGNRFIKNTDSNGRYHSDWCSMIYSRLMIARSLLSEDGMIFISIDDNEVENMQKIANEIFGENNKINIFTWVKKKKGSHLSKTTRSMTEYVIAFAKNKEEIELYGEDAYSDKQQPLAKRTNAIKKLTFPANTIVANLDDGEYEGKHGVGTSAIVFSKFIVKDGIVITECQANGPFTWTQPKLDEELKLGTKVFLSSKFGFNVLRSDQSEKIKRPSTLIDASTGVGTNEDAYNEALSIFGHEGIMSYPKPTSLIKYLVNTKTYFDKNAIVLDFFSGSATTAHAVMQLNAEDGGNRKFIMVQLPEETTEDSEAYKAGYKNICEIGKERIRRAGKKIKEESPLTTQYLDTGFRVFRVDSSNYEEVEHTPKDWNQDQLDLFLNNIKSDRTDLDLLFGCMLDWGVQLSLPMTTEEVDGKKIYIVNEGDLVACFADKVTDNVVRAMAYKQPLRVIFRDSCFERDADKINIYETFKQLLDWSDQEVVKNIRVI